VLDRRCGTCNLLMRHFDGALPGGVWLLVLAESVGAADEWLTDTGFGPRAVHAGRIAAATPASIDASLGLSVTPMALTVTHGRLAQADTIPSVRRFFDLLPSVVSRYPGSLTPVEVLP
jgi:hypothetical protein